MAHPSVGLRPPTLLLFISIQDFLHSFDHVHKSTEPTPPRDKRSARTSPNCPSLNKVRAKILTQSVHKVIYNTLCMKPLVMH
jgi:hypothetical protein